MKVVSKHNKDNTILNLPQQTPDVKADSDLMPFNFDNEIDYRDWRAQKLAHYPATERDLLVSIENLNVLSELEVNQIKSCLNKFNMVIYSLNTPRKITASELCQFTKRFGLTRIDGNLCSGELNVSTVTVTNHLGKKNYIPYTNKTISWHTDGYYNTPQQTIRSFVLHCNQSAHRGGENSLIDPDIIYILLRDENLDYIKALMQESVLTIPENIENGIEVRARQSGPVFSIDSGTGKLHMRYTARTRSIEWLTSPIVQQAVAAIDTILKTNADYSFKYKLQAGQGLLCNNVLHNRVAFDDQAENQGLSDTDTTATKRELLRARYYDSIVF